jgi:hypothetical protein
MIVGAHLSLRIARRSPEQPSACAQRQLVATVCGGTAEAFIAGDERTGACSPSGAVAVDTADVREVTVAAVEVRRVGRVGRVRRCRSKWRKRSARGSACRSRRRMRGPGGVRDAPGCAGRAGARARAGRNGATGRGRCTFAVDVPGPSAQAARLATRGRCLNAARQIRLLTS